MRKTLFLVAALGAGAALLPATSQASPARWATAGAHQAARHSIQHADYYWHHHHWKHREWDRHHLEWRYYD